MNNLYDLLVTQDLSQRLIRKFLGQTKRVSIEVFDDQYIAHIMVMDPSCSQISNTGRWSWSIRNMPEGSCGNFKYVMSSDSGEVCRGEFSISKEVNNGC